MSFIPQEEGTANAPRHRSCRSSPFPPSGNNGRSSTMFTRGSLRHACRQCLWFLCLCALALSLHARAAGTGAQGDWWMFHHDPQHTGRSAFNGPSAPLLKWKYATNDSIVMSSPALGADGTIYVGSYDYNLYALNPSDGLVKWKSATRAFIDSSPAISTDGTIYIGSDDNYLYALNPVDGSLKWKYVTGIRSSSPLRPSVRTGRSTSDHVIITSMPSTRRMARCKWQYNTKI